MQAILQIFDFCVNLYLAHYTAARESIYAAKIPKRFYWICLSLFPSFFVSESTCQSNHVEHMQGNARPHGESEFPLLGLTSPEPYTLLIMNEKAIT